MADFVFELGTQADATAFEAGDELIFNDIAPTDVGVVFTAASGFQLATVTLSAGGKELTFAADELGDPTTEIRFLGAGGDLVIGTSGLDAALTIGGDDASAVWGLGGIDTIAVTAGEGDHIVHGGTGDDTVTVAGATGNLLVFGEDGDDSVTLDAASTGNASIDGGDGDDTIDASAVVVTDATDTDPGTGHLYILGGGGDDSLSGGAGNDHIYGLSTGAVQGVTDGSDTIDAGEGNDVVNGNAGDDSIAGGEGNDRVSGGQGDDAIFGGEGNDSLQGNLGDDSLDGGEGNDSVRGGQGDDLVFGGEGNDTVFGDLGDDTVSGGAGHDVISGGAGADVFVFEEGDALGLDDDGVPVDLADVTLNDVNGDAITDFSAADDLLDLGAGFSDEVLYITDGSTATTFSAAYALAADAMLDDGGAGDVVSVQVGADTYLFFDADGGTDLDSFIKMTGVTASAITEDSFVVAA